ncbi:MAG: ThiF family adenylyltransferase [Clostridiales bacterium]|nr:ThiF family adenylyltransferase [Clostridiales bacterium]
MFTKKHDEAGGWPNDIDGLSEKHVAVVGLGGLGGYISEQFARMGVGTLALIDDDRFEPGNLGRQLFCTEETLGQPKATTAKKRITLVNSKVQVNAHEARLETANAPELLSGADLVMDALDNIHSRRKLQAACAKLALPFVHGAVAGWWGQAATVFPGDDTLDLIYANAESAPKNSMIPAFTPAFLASAQVAEGLRLLLGKPPLLRKKLLFADLLSLKSILIDL